MHAEDLLLSQYAHQVITFKANQLSRQRGFTSADREDLEQDFRLALINKATQYDAARGAVATFIGRVVASAAAMSARDRRRLKRAAGCAARSLDAPLSNGDEQPATLAEAVSYADVARRTGAMVDDDLAKFEVAEAIDIALAKMPEDVGDICRRLMGGTIASVARDMGISRHKVRIALDRARPFFEQVGLDY